MDILKPYLEKLASFIASQTVPLVGTAVSLIVVWLYADLYMVSPLNKHEVFGFCIIIFFSLWCACLLFRALRKLLPLLAIGCLVLPIGRAHADQLKVVDIPANGIHEVDLAELSLIRFKFPFTELSLVNTPPAPEETDCLTYKRSDEEDFKVNFCGYGKMYNEAINSIIADSNGKTAYAYDLYELRSGGGGNFGIVLDFPSTDLKDYQANNGLQIESLCRVFMPKKPDAKAYSGFGMYAFILLRDRGTNRDRKKSLVEAYLSILPNFSSDSFGVPRDGLGVLVYPTKFNSEDIYQGFNAAGWETGGDSDMLNAIEKAYNYDFSTTILKTMKKITKNDPPEFSVVFVKSTTGSMSLKEMDWDNALMLDISEVTDYEDFFVDLNNFFVYGLEEKQSDIFSVARKFAASTGRLALIAFEGGK